MSETEIVRFGEVAAVSVLDESTDDVQISIWFDGKGAEPVNVAIELPAGMLRPRDKVSITLRVPQKSE